MDVGPVLAKYNSRKAPQDQMSLKMRVNNILKKVLAAMWHEISRNQETLVVELLVYGALTWTVQKGRERRECVGLHSIHGTRMKIR